jgi:hypothetical protein
VSNATVEPIEEVDQPDRDTDRHTNGKNVAWELLTFRRMVAPIIIQVLFWVGLGGLVVNSSWMVVAGIGSVAALRNAWGLLLLVAWCLAAVVSFIVGTLLLRLYCELAIVLFRCQESLHFLASHQKQEEEA